MAPCDQTTLDYYERHADEFVRGTKDVGMNHLLKPFLARIPDRGRVLDLGCGSGRDSLSMSRMGYDVTSMDASPAMCRATAELTGGKVVCKAFQELDDEDAYDGVWACASLLHLRPDELPDVLARIRRALVDGGTLYCSFKQGAEDGYRRGRWFTDLDADGLRELLSPLFDVDDVWLTGDARPGRDAELWVNALATSRIKTDDPQGE